MVTSELALSECLVKPLADNNMRAITAYQELFSRGSWLAVMAVTRDILVSAARIRADTRLKLADAIHLATALEAGCARSLTNDRDFRGIDGLELARWDEL